MKSQHSELFYYVMAVYGLATFANLAFPNTAFDYQTGNMALAAHHEAASATPTQVSERNIASAKIIGAALIAGEPKF